MRQPLARSACTRATTRHQVAALNTASTMSSLPPLPSTAKVTRSARASRRRPPASTVFTTLRREWGMWRALLRYNRYTCTWGVHGENVPRRGEDIVRTR